ncbi:MAG TPA: spore coat U domain-containing protein [Candidatus Obscuribacterales bacterium]
MPHSANLDKQVFSRRRSATSSLTLFAAAISLLLMAPLAHSLASCSVSASGVAFGNYLYTAASPTDSTGNVQVSCSLLDLVSVLVSYEIILSEGNSGAYTPRQLTSGANVLSYNLYTDPAYTLIWGDAGSGTTTVSDGYLLGLLTVVRDYSVYGRLPASQNTPAGSYSDTIIVTVSY